MFHACIFDLDGTLVNSLRDLADAVNHALQLEGYSIHEVPAFRHFVGNGIPKLIERALPADAQTPEIHARMLGLFNAYYQAHRTDHTAPYDGIPALLDCLRERGIQTAVVSNKADAFTKQIVTDLFGERFPSVLGSRPNIPRKPDPTSTLETAERLGVQPADCLFLGDSGVDMQTAANAGMIGVGVLWGFRDRQELLENGAKKLIAHPEELLAFLDCAAH